MPNSFYEEFTYNGVLYSVDCELLKDGEYDYVPPSSDDSGGHDIIEEPKFCNFIFTNLDTLDGTGKPTASKKITDVALEILNELYWEGLLDE